MSAIKEQYNKGNYNNANDNWYDIKSRVGGDTPRALLKEGLYTENYYQVIVDKRNVIPQVIVHDIYKFTLDWNALTINQCAYAPVPDIEYIDILPRMLELYRQSTFNVGVTLLEGRESLKLIGDTLLQLGRAARALKRFDLRGALNALASVPARNRRAAANAMERRDLVNTWLELRYGWRPLIGDIFSLLESIHFDPKQNVIRSSVIHEGGTSQEGPNYSAGFHSEFKNEKRLHIKMVYSQPPTQFERFGLTDPASIVWELIPFSFVVDWFVPIQSTLLSLHAITAIPVVSYVETRVEYKKRVGYVPKNYALVSPKDMRTVHGAGYLDEQFDMYRSVGNLPTGLDVLNGVPRSIKSVWDFDVLRVADASALLVSVLRSFR